MCVESVYWRCHRRLVSDFLLANGNAVQHIFPFGGIATAPADTGAKFDAGRVTYPAEQKSLFFE